MPNSKQKDDGPLPYARIRESAGEVPRARFPLKVAGGKTVKCRSDGPISAPIKDLTDEYGGE